MQPDPRDENMARRFKTGGRRKGTPNKLTRELREMIMGALAAERSIRLRIRAERSDQIRLWRSPDLQPVRKCFGVFSGRFHDVRPIRPQIPAT
jgi:hypothetical protein